MNSPSTAKRGYDAVIFMLVGLLLWLVITLVCRTNWSSSGGVLGLVYVWAYAHIVSVAALADLLPSGFVSSLRGYRGLIFEALLFGLAGLVLWGISKRFGRLERRTPLVRATFMWGAAEALLVLVFAAAGAMGLVGD